MVLKAELGLDIKTTAEKGINKEVTGSSPPEKRAPSPVCIHSAL